MENWIVGKGFGGKGIGLGFMVNAGVVCRKENPPESKSLRTNHAQAFWVECWAYCFTHLRVWVNPSTSNRTK